MPETIPTNEARQGRGGKTVLTILVAALVLVAIAWGIAEFYGQASETENTADQPGQTVP